MTITRHPLAGRPVGTTTTTPTTAFGALVRHLRVLHRLSQATLADRSGLDKAHVSRLESGARMPTLAVVVAIAGALDLSPGQRDRLLRAAYTDIAEREGRP